jgi:hypothetical protein
MQTKRHAQTFLRLIKPHSTNSTTFLQLKTLLPQPTRYVISLNHSKCSVKLHIAPALTHWGRVFFPLYLSQIINSEWRHVSSNIRPGGPFREMLHVLCNEVRGNQARVKNADLCHSSFTVVMQKRKFASPILNVLTFNNSAFCPQCSFKNFQLCSK